MTLYDVVWTVIAGDGIHSKVRQLLLGQDNPASRPSFTHKVTYRAIIPIADSIPALGDDKADNRCAHMGPDAHALSCPVSGTTCIRLIYLAVVQPRLGCCTSEG